MKQFKGAQTIKFWEPLAFPYLNDRSSVRMQQQENG
jgi:hypothetical protein